MEKLYCKTKLSTIALILVLTISAIIIVLPTVGAQDPARRVAYPYIGASPNPIGVGQQVLLHVGITQQLPSVNYGWDGLTISVIDPEGIESTLGPYRTDATGGTGDIFMPTMVGEYILQTHFPEQPTPAFFRSYMTGEIVPEGTIMEASDSEELVLVVQEEQRTYYPGQPLPSEYWTRPIDAQFREWNSIAGNWLTPMLRGLVVAPYNDDAPETAHILWAKPMQMGGLAGGVEFGPQGYECGDAYEGLYADSVIIGGVLYYNAHKSGFPTQTVVAVDLHTGEELWNKPLMDPDGNIDRLSFGQVFYWDSYNYHGVFPYLWTTSGSTWYAFDPFDGSWVYGMEDVPSGTSLRGPKGEIYIATVNIEDGWMTLWNSSRAVSAEGSWLRRAMGAIINATENGFEWNITIPLGLPGSVREVVLGDRVVGTQVTRTEVNSWAFSLKPGQEGLLLFNNTWTAPAEWVTTNLDVSMGQLSLEYDVFTLIIPQLRQHYGFSIETGQQIWGPTESQYYLDFFVMGAFICDDKYISSCMGGTLYAYDITTGKLLWTYPSADPYTEILWSDNWPMRALMFTDGKLYITHSEHSSVDPKARGAPFVCLNVTTGEEIFRINGAFRGTEWGGNAIIGDSIIATQDTYDQRVYAIGKGPSATTVSIQNDVISLGSSALLNGMVTDESPGTKEYALTARFPNGVPAVSDVSMSDWMLYVYKQFERPEDATGVTVKLEAVDPNNKYVDIGTTKSDAYGNYGFTFTPDVEGKYMIIATFEGSSSYYGSITTTYLTVGPAAEEPEVKAETDYTPMFIGIIIAVIIAILIGLVNLFALRKQK